MRVSNNFVFIRLILSYVALKLKLCLTVQIDGYLDLR